MRTGPGPVTAADVDDVVTDAVRVLNSRLDRDWNVAAAGLDWNCWETVEHVADDLFAYAAQLTPKRAQLDGYLPIDAQRRWPGGPMSTIFADPKAGNAGLVTILDACGGLLSAAVKVAPDAVRGYHPAGVSDPEGFAAMGVVEVVIHLFDLAPVLDFDWVADEDLCDRVLHRLFPAAPTDTERWPTLLWAAGRVALSDRPKLETWRWYGEPRP